MGVYINMEMPKTGEYRCVIRKWQQGGTLTIDLYGEEELCGTIVPIPKHGRLIDADALRAEVKKHATPSDAWVFSLIRTAPTALEAEEGE